MIPEENPMIFKPSKLQGLVAGAAFALAISLPAAASVDVSGYKFEDTTQVAGKELKLNGAGMRTKFVIKVYAAGLYVPEKKNNTADILKEEGPRRVTIQMARDVSSEDFGKAFMEGLNDNVLFRRSARWAKCLPASTASKKATCCTWTGSPAPAPRPN
jgi:hypothetical protein